ncbi:MAG: class II aldolase/adducin family protein [Alphaproteobacteria bacterium]
MTAADVVVAYRELADRGLNQGSAGNVSVRSGAGMLITPTGARAETLTAERIVPCALDGTWDGHWVPSSEWAMHAAVYARFPAAGAVVHTHSDACVALACLRRDLPAFHYMVAGFGGADVRCAPYATFGTPALAEGAAAALEGRTACLLANHGMLCHGKDAAAAVATAVKLETLVRQYLMTLQSGDPVLLDAEEMARVAEKYRSYGRQPAAGALR